MPERTKIVSAMLRIARQIVVSDDFARDAAAYADLAANIDDEAAAALRAIVTARKIELAQMRTTLSLLAKKLASLPIEAA
ncbi:hypothetical protein [Methylobacterium gnaphalii]|uniref:Uncharacterized protein n=1 Tax=Methylobacterium gnaphalii TaxID=1010610 RepID=A0A512JGH2_9HYPH|nr:hypothetical protein [Methylobacterium gnaphalii]GEP09058.1 hypothetical protein MGN01_09030 [Methylobacterium gnaphalii]GJD68371.1 hypothetical protein MMMDOFMJ_1294 [Methylobacterium gnaphalii]GLS48982.1 hypothetical protein GCM10007885_18290 [Methylobacterium gnaphalii]